MLLRLGEDRGRVGRDDVALVADGAKGIAGPLQLVQEADRLWRVALEVQLEGDGGVREAAQGLRHLPRLVAFSSRCPSSIDIHLVWSLILGWFGS